MKEKSHKKLRIILISVLTGLTLIYLAGVWFFHYHLLPGSRINDTGLSLKTPLAAEKSLEKPEEKLILHFPEDKTEEIAASRFELGLDYSAGIEAYKNRQNAFLWFIPEDGNETIRPVTVYDSEKLKKELMALPEMQKETTRAPQDAYMALEKGKAIIIPEVEGTEMDTDKVFEAVTAALDRGKREINLDCVDYLIRPALMSDSERLVKQTEKLNHFLATTITYWLYDGSSETIDAETLSRWLMKTEDGKFYYLDPTELKRRCSAYASMLAFRKNITYDTVDFSSSRLGRVEIPAEQEKFGYEIDVEEETEALYKNLMDRLSTVRKPEYAFAREFRDFLKDGYVEVDLVNQKVYYYLGGTLFYTCDCVTGLYTESGRHTPVGVYEVQYKGREVDLRGRPDENGVPMYQSHVAFWMPFYGGYGLHDAAWQSSFGGERYKTHGSHGCVNLDYASAERIYYNISAGTPVIVVGEEAYR